MSTYRLHYFPESGNSYKLALMLTLCGETFDPVWTDFGGGVTRTPEWRKAVNEMGEIPVCVGLRGDIGLAENRLSAASCRPSSDPPA